MEEDVKRFALAAGKRALHTAAQTFGGYLAAASVLADVQWDVAASATALATLVSVVKSVSLGVPEVPEV